MTGKAGDTWVEPLGTPEEHGGRNGTGGRDDLDAATADAAMMGALETEEGRSDGKKTLATMSREWEGSEGDAMPTEWKNTGGFQG